MHYEGSLAETGEVFDTTHEDNTIFSFELGKGSVIKAWDVALRTMKVLTRFYVYNSTFELISSIFIHKFLLLFQVGEVAKITCKADYAYGSAGSPPDIPPE